MHETHRQGMRVYRVDIDFRNAFNAISQAALWHVMNIFIYQTLTYRRRFTTAQQSVWSQTTWFKVLLGGLDLHL